MLRNLLIAGVIVSFGSATGAVADDFTCTVEVITAVALEASADVVDGDTTTINGKSPTGNNPFESNIDPDTSNGEYIAEVVASKNCELNVTLTDPNSKDTVLLKTGAEKGRTPVAGCETGSDFEKELGCICKKSSNSHYGKVEYSCGFQ